MNTMRKDILKLLRKKDDNWVLLRVDSLVLMKKQLGLTEGLNKGINAFIKLCKDMHLSDDDTVNKLIEDYQLSKDEAVKAVENYY